MSDIFNVHVVQVKRSGKSAWDVMGLRLNVAGIGSIFGTKGTEDEAMAFARTLTDGRIVIEKQAYANEERGAFDGRPED